MKMKKVAEKVKHEKMTKGGPSFNVISEYESLFYATTVNIAVH